MQERGSMKNTARSIIILLALAAAPLLLGCARACPPWNPSPAPSSIPEHRLEPIEDGELNWSYWPDVVKTPVFGD
jgi:hypothetical protein